jgi:hypothetical protein
MVSPEAYKTLQVFDISSNPANTPNRALFHEALVYLMSTGTIKKILDPYTNPTDPEFHIEIEPPVT